MEKKLKSHGAWIGKWTFILAATGSAVGLGNIWGFPYKAGTNGGGAFVLIYLLCIVMIGVPIMISEIIIGRRAGNSPINAMKRTALDSNSSSLWRLVGWSGITAGVLILSFYSVIAGICLNYIFIAASPSSVLSSSEQFGIVIASPFNLLFWHTVFMLLTFLIVSAGVKNGIGRMVKILMPMLGFLLIFMVIYAMFNGAFVKTLEFLFAPDFSNVTAETFLSAMGQAFFSLSLGMGSIMAYGAYIGGCTADQEVAYRLANFNSSGCFQDQAGQTGNNAPELAASMYANYFKEIAESWKMTLSINANYQDDVYSNTDNDPNAFTEEYTKVNISAALEHSDGFEVSIFARNVTDEVTATQLLDLPLVPGSHFALWAPGKEVGISFRGKF